MRTFRPPPFATACGQAIVMQLALVRWEVAGLLVGVAKDQLIT